MIRKYTENTSLKYKYFNKHVFEPRSVVKKKNVQWLTGYVLFNSSSLVNCKHQPFRFSFFCVRVSQNKKWLVLESRLSGVKQRPELRSSLIIWARDFDIKVYSRRDRGHPCLTSMISTCQACAQIGLHQCSSLLPILWVRALLPFYQLVIFFLLINYFIVSLKI